MDVITVITSLYHYKCYSKKEQHLMFQWIIYDHIFGVVGSMHFLKFFVMHYLSVSWFIWSKTNRYFVNCLSVHLGSAVCVSVKDIWFRHTQTCSQSAHHKKQEM